MGRFRLNLLPLVLLLAAAILSAGRSPSARAAIVFSGNVEPYSTGMWTSSSRCYVGKTSDGSMTLTLGSVLESGDGYLGYNAGTSGTATITGAGSKWIAHYSLFVGDQGQGMLTVADGGLVIAETLFASLDHLSGNGTIAARGAVLDIDLAFDATHGRQQTIAFGAGGALNLNVNEPGALGAGHQGSGTLRIADGMAVSSIHGYLGYGSGSSGTATVSGTGSNWTISHVAYVGYSGNGTLNIEGGGQVGILNSHSYLGYNPGSSGTVTVTGAGSKWTASIPENLYIGYSGSGTLNVTAGGQVVNSQQSNLGYAPGSSGTASVSGTGSQWNTGLLFVGCSGNGTLNIASGGQVSDSEGTLGFAAGSSGTVTVTGAGSKWTNADVLTVGYSGRGTLSIVAGGEVSTRYGFLGQKAGSSGAVTVSGAGSKWNIAGPYSGLYVGSSGNGTLSITGGGAVSTSNVVSYVGYISGSSGLVLVDGPGSKWTNNGTLAVGHNGKGTLNTRGGGAVTASSVWINSQSVLSIDVGGGSELTVGNGTGTITNNGGKVRILAGAGVAAGEAYSPIAAGTWSGTGSTQAVGGTWDGTSRVFTVSAVEPGAAGAPLTIDLFDKQRAKVSDATTGWTLGASFLAKTSPTSLSVTATAIAGATRTAIEPLVPSDESLRGGWQFTTNSGYAAGEPAYLSFDLGAGYSRADVSVWRYSGTTWAGYDASDLTYDGRYASFTVTDLNSAGYALAGTLTRAWNGGAGGDDWSQGANWNNGVAFMPTDVVVFDGTTRLAANNDLTNQQLAGLKFATGAGAFQLGGNGLKLAGKIDDQATAKQEINLPVEFVAGPSSGTVNVVVVGELTISQPVSGNQGLTKTGLGMLELLQDTAYIGNTDVQAGTLVLQGLANSGSTTVGGTLYADYIRQNTLTIGAGGTVSINPTVGPPSSAAVSLLQMPGAAIGYTGDAGSGASAVPEPATWLLVAMAALAGFIARRRC